jgi:hypothetical protein
VIGRDPHRVIGAFSCVERAGKKIDDVGDDKHADQREDVHGHGACQSETDANPIPAHSDQRRTDKCSDRGDRRDDRDIIRNQIPGTPGSPSMAPHSDFG